MTINLSESNMQLIRHGLLLMLLALIGALLIPAARIPRLALSAHTIGMLGSVILMVVGMLWHQFQLSVIQKQFNYYCWLVSAWLNWGACLFGALVGAGQMTPVAANGVSGNTLSEFIMTISLSVVVLSSLLAVGFTLWGLRSNYSLANEAVACQANDA